MESTSRKSRNGAMAAWVVLAALVAWTSQAVSDSCPSDKVYPYWSICTTPATYGSEYTLASASGTYSLQGLAPEWDETNSTYYVRLNQDSSATYKLTYSTSSSSRSSVAQGEDVMIVNVDSGRSLGWRQEGDESFLVEVESDAAYFQFEKAADVSLPCPLILLARCEAYYIVSYGSSKGLSLYSEDDAVYFKESSSDLMPFVLLAYSSSSQANAKIASVV